MTDAKKSATLTIEGENYELPVHSPSAGPDVIDIRKLYGQAGVFTYDPGYTSTASCDSTITFIDGDEGVLLHRGYAIEELANSCSFLEVAYLLLFGKLPNKVELEEWQDSMKRHSLLNEELKRFFNAFPKKAHPMAILSSATNAISTFYEEYHDPQDDEAIIQSAQRLLAKMPTVMSSWSF